MSAPLCLHCHAQPVKRITSGRVVGPRRTIEGKRYRHYCSRACTARAIGAIHGASPKSTADLIRRNRDTFRHRTRTELLVEATDLMAGATVGDVMKALWKRDQSGYHRGFAAAWAQRRKQGVA